MLAGKMVAKGKKEIRLVKGSKRLVNRSKTIAKTVLKLKGALKDKTRDSS